MSTGWFSVNRKLFDNEIWYLEPFTKGQAWIDLIGNANHKEGQFEIRGNIITIKRGQIGWSELTMSKRWKWSRNKTRRYLKWLETIHQIEQQKLFKLTTIITIINYDMYQNDTTDDTTERQQKVQQKVHKQQRINNDNNNKQENTYTDKKLNIEQISGLIVDAFNHHLGTRFKRSDSFKNNLEYWLKTYEPSEIEQAIKNVKYDKFWKDKMTPVVLFRRKNPQGEPVDYISQLLLVKKNYE